MNTKKRRTMKRWKSKGLEGDKVEKENNNYTKMKERKKYLKGRKKEKIDREDGDFFFFERNWNKESGKKQQEQPKE